MRKIVLFISMIISISCYAQGLIILKTNSLKISINEKGKIISFSDPVSGNNYIVDGEYNTILSIRIEGKYYVPETISWNEKASILNLKYKSNGINAEIKIIQKQTYISFELIKIIGSEKLDLVLWGPFNTTIRKMIGETVGVVWDDKYAIGIQSLNVKTLGGYPTNEDDVEPSFDIFKSGSLVDVNDSVSVLYRGQTAIPVTNGSILQAYCRNRFEERVIKVWEHDNYVVPAYNDGGVVGSKIALFGCPSAQALQTIGVIELEECLPHPEIDGKWGKTSPKASASYLIIPFSEENLDEAVDITKRAGLEYLYHAEPFKKWGHFELDAKAFPDNWESMRRCVEKAKNMGVSLGVHTLSNFITVNDAYVTPVPDSRLAKVGGSQLTEDIGTISSEIAIENPVFFNQMRNNNLHAVIIGNEIIRYQGVSDSIPWRLHNCERGAFGTRISDHQKGEVVSKLMDHGYKTFLTDINLSKEVASRIADFCNYTGIRQLSFDGLEGNWSTGMGQYGCMLFAKAWYDKLDKESKGKIINDASTPGHFFWHIYSRMNWGEPWYDGFRESQTQYRLMNQDYFRRNLMPSMLGWFSMSSQTSIEDMEWLLSRAAGFNAGFAFCLDFNIITTNGQSSVILETLRQWETARLAQAFSVEQKNRLRDISKEFHLQFVDSGEWKLFPYQIYRYDLNLKSKQPGEPTFNSFEFNNPFADQAMMFILTMLPTEDQGEIFLKTISIEVNNYRKIEIPVDMSPSQTLKLDESGKLRVYDKKWNLLRSIDIKETIPLLSKGSNQIIFDAVFAGGGSSKIKIEMKTMGNPEVVKAID